VVRELLALERIAVNQAMGGGFTLVCMDCRECGGGAAVQGEVMVGAIDHVESDDE